MDRSGRSLHRSGRPLLLANLWDAASAQLARSLGASAIATTSARLARALGQPDGDAVQIDEHAAALRRIARRLGCPLSADAEGGYSSDPATAADNDRVRSGLTRQVRPAVSAGRCGAPHFERRRTVNCRFEDQLPWRQRQPDDETGPQRRHHPRQLPQPGRGRQLARVGDRAVRHADPVGGEQRPGTRLGAGEGAAAQQRGMNPEGRGLDRRRRALPLSRAPSGALRASRVPRTGGILVFPCKLAAPLGDHTARLSTFGRSMARTPQRSVWLSVPDAALTRRLRAALMLLDIIPEPLTAAQAVQRVNAAPEHELPTCAAVIDVPDASAPLVAGALSFVTLLHAVPDRARRAAIVLTRVGGPHISDAERDWALASGFAAWWGDGSRFVPGSEAQVVMNMLGARSGLGEVPATVLAHADGLDSGADRLDAARRRCQRWTGLTPADWMLERASHWPIADRRWRLRSYPQCLVGSEAVTQWVRAHGVTREAAVALGRTLRAEGLLRHVTDEHDFDDAELFFELLPPQAVRRPDADELLATLVAGISVQDHHWRGREYAQCWIGEQAVDVLVKVHGLSRLQAWLGLRRLMQLGCFDHVLREQPMRDGHFFYRFTAVLGRRN